MQIGDYIHLRRDAYLNLNQIKPYKKKTLFSSYKKDRDDALRRFDKSSYKIGGNPDLADKLEKALNELFPTTQESLNDEKDKFKQAILKDIVDHLDRAPELIKHILNASIEKGALSAVGDETEENKVATRRSQLTKIRSILQDIQTRIEEDDRKRLGWKRDIVDILTGVTKIERIRVPEEADKDKKRQIHKINGQFIRAKRMIKQCFPKTTDTIEAKDTDYRPTYVITQEGRVKGQSLTISTRDGQTYTINEENVAFAIDAITQVILADAIITKDIGDGAEYALGAVARACNLDTNGKAKKAIKQYVFGDARTSIYFNLDLFSGDLGFLAEATSKSSTGQEKKLYTAIEEAVGGKQVVKGYKSTSASQDKIDVIYESEDVSAILQHVMTEKDANKAAESMSLSVKNYTQGGTFGGVSGTSFLSLVQSIPPAFVNHWINLTIGHQKEDDPSSFDFVSEIKEKEVNDAHLIMQRYLIKLGVAGGVLKFSKKEQGARLVDQAQYIVWNDRSGSQKEVTWHVYSIQQILSGVKKMTDLNSYVKGDYKKFRAQDKKGWVTKAIETDQTDIDINKIIQQRINNVLKFMWEQKITTETPVNKALAALGKNLTS